MDGPEEVAGNAYRARGGWVLTSSWRRFWTGFVQPDGTKRRDARGQVELVSKDGRSYVSDDTHYDRRLDHCVTILRQIRVRDGAVLAKRRFPCPVYGETSALQLSAGRVLVERDERLGRNGAGNQRYTTMWWTPRTGKVSVIWRRTARPDAVLTRPPPVSPPARSPCGRGARARRSETCALAGPCGASLQPSTLWSSRPGATSW